MALKRFTNGDKLKADQINYDENTSILDAIFPIGRGFIDFTNTDYSNYLGFTWERELVGMTAVGLDATQTEFNTIGKTGGSKYLQEHNHSVSTGSLFEDGTIFPNYSAISKENTGGTVTRAYNVVTTYAGTGNSGNLQPYKVVAYWKRTA